MTPAQKRSRIAQKKDLGNRQVNLVEWQHLKEKVRNNDNDKYAQF